jgi:hypothetical protein
MKLRLSIMNRIEMVTGFSAYALFLELHKGWLEPLSRYVVTPMQQMK